MIIGTAGHIDHGKTTLVKALTGIDADRLKEEKARGITIELGFAYWPQHSGETIGFVDVPGHERFVHTMLMGAQGLDAALLVVAADDGIMPQTREHLEILALSGLGKGLVALTKIDRVNAGRVDAVKAAIAALLSGTPLAGAPVFPVSAQTGEGMAALAEALRTLAENHSRRPEAHAFRLAVDRVFTLAGAGTIVTGMAIDGVVRLEDEVVLSPSGKTARIRAIHAQNVPTTLGRAGERCALNLAGLARDEVRRGDMVTMRGFHAPLHRFDARLILASAAAHGLKEWMPARLHHATTEVGVRLLPLEAKAAASGETLLVQVVCDTPLSARLGDRFILRDVSASHTLAGGIILDMRPPTRKRRTSERLAALNAMADGRTLFTRAHHAEPINLSHLSMDSGVTADALADAAKAHGFVVLDADGQSLALRMQSLAALESRIAEALLAFHADKPDLFGLGLERLRLLCARTYPAPLFRLLLRAMVRRGLVAMDGHFIRHPSHSMALSPAEEALWATIAPALAGEYRLRPPRVRDVARALAQEEGLIRRLFKRKERLGIVHEVALDHYFTREAMAELVRLAHHTPLMAGHNLFSAASFRDEIEKVGGPVGRKVAIQILECLDRHGVTIRRGDARRMNIARLDLFEPSPDN